MTSRPRHCPRAASGPTLRPKPLFEIRLCENTPNSTCSPNNVAIKILHVQANLKSGCYRIQHYAFAAVAGFRDLCTDGQPAGSGIGRMFMKLNLNKSLFALGVTSVLALVISGVTALGFSRSLGHGQYSIQMASTALRNHLECDMMHDAIRGDVLAAFIAKDAAELTECKKQLDEHVTWFREKLDENSKLDLPQSVKDAAEQVLPTLTNYVDSAAGIIHKAGTDRTTALVELGSFLKVYEELEGKMESLSDVIEQAGKDYSAVQASQFRNFRYYIAGITILSSIVLSLVILVQVRRITTPLREAMNIIVDGSSSVSGKARQLLDVGDGFRDSASRQRAALEETLSSLNLLSETGIKTNTSAANAINITSSARQLATTGENASARLIEAIREIEASARETARVIEAIDKIASQTNLLALNASVEAARAGEAGRGFAVVATEVGNLAKQSAASAKSTGELVTRALQAAERGTDAAKDVANTIAEMCKAYCSVDAVVSDIAKDVQVQQSAISQANELVQQIDVFVANGDKIAAKADQDGKDLSDATLKLDNAVSTVSQIISYKPEEASFAKAA